MPYNKRYSQIFTQSRLILLFVLRQNGNAEVQLAFVGRRNKLLQISSVPQFHVQTQEGAVHLLEPLQALLSVPDCPEKRLQEANVTQIQTSVLFPASPEIIALVFWMKLRMKVYSQHWLHIRVQLDYFSWVQLTFTDQAVMELGLILRWCLFLCFVLTWKVLLPQKNPVCKILQIQPSKRCSSAAPARLKKKKRVIAVDRLDRFEHASLNFHSL